MVAVEYKRNYSTQHASRRMIVISSILVSTLKTGDHFLWEFHAGSYRPGVSMGHVAMEECLH